MTDHSASAVADSTAAPLTSVVLGQVIEHFLDEYHHSPEFYYGVNRAMQGSTDAEIIAGLLAGFQASTKTVRELRDELIRHIQNGGCV